MTHFLCQRVRKGFLPCESQCTDCRAEEDATTPGPLAAARPMVCFECGRPRRAAQQLWCSCGSTAWVEQAPISLTLPVAEVHEHHPQAVIRGIEATELPGDARTWDAWDTATITMDLQPDK